MPENNLEAKITLDVSDLKKGLEDAKKAQTDYEKSLSDTQQAIDKSIGVSKDYERSLKRIQKDFKDGVLSQKEYNTQLEKIQASQKATAAETENLRQKLSDLKNTNVGQVSVDAEKINQSFEGINKSSPAFRLINQATGGIAGDAANIANGMKGATLSANAFKAALVSTGIGALVIAVASIAVYWDDIATAINGANRELARQRKDQEELVGIAQNELDLIDAQLDSLKLQGLSDKEINKLKRERLTILLNEKKAVLEIARVQLESTIQSEKASREMLQKFTKFAVDSQIKIAKGFDSIFGTKLASDIEATYASALDFFSGDKSEEAKKGIQSLELELVKLQNQIDKTRLDDIKIDQAEKDKPSPEIDQAEKDAEILRKIDAQLWQDKISDAKEAAKKQGGEVAEVLFRETGKLPDPKIFIDVDSEDAFRKIVDIEKKLADIKKKFGEGAYNIALSLPTDELDAFQEKLQISKGIAQGAAMGISTAFDTMSQAVMKNTDQTDSALTRFASSLGSSVLKIMATYLSQAVAGAIAGGTASGSATGPGAIVAIPTMIATLTAAVLGAFASIPKFAQGGIVPGGSFSGDKIPAMLNSGEMVLNTGQQANLFKALDGSLSSLQNRANNDTLVASTVLRGEDIYLSVTRQERIQKRFN